MEKITIDSTDIILEDLGNEQGKIIIADTYGYNYSTYWGAMGGSLKEFLMRINEDYFINRLLPSDDRGVFSGKKSVRNVRKHIKTELSYEIPWYKYMSAQKELRERLKEIESCESDHEFIDAMQRISNDVYCFELDRHDEERFKDALKSLESEPWHFIETEPSRHSIFLHRIFKRLQKELKKKHGRIKR